MDNIRGDQKFQPQKQVGAQLMAQGLPLTVQMPLPETAEFHGKESDHHEENTQGDHHDAYRADRQ